MHLCPLTHTEQASALATETHNGKWYFTYNVFPDPHELVIPALSALNLLRVFPVVSLKDKPVWVYSLRDNEWRSDN